MKVRRSREEAGGVACSQADGSVVGQAQPSDHGATATEYALMVGFIAVVIVGGSCHVRSERQRPVHRAGRHLLGGERC